MLTRFILYEAFFKTNYEELHELTKKDISKVLNIGFVPETSGNWQKLLSDARFTIEHVSTGELVLFNPISLIKDEGVSGFTKIVFNAVTQPYLQKRILATKVQVLDL